MLPVSTYPGIILEKDSTEEEAVVKIQIQLNKKGYFCEVDGDFGKETEKQVKEFQKDQTLLEVDGMVGPLTWEKLFDEIPPEEPSKQTMKVLQTLSRRKDVFHQPTYQDNTGTGMFSSKGNKDRLSEPVYPPFVLGPRRQVDSLVRQVQALLPNQEIAFIITDRLVQYPHEYLPYISGAKSVVLIGSFVGIGATEEDFKKAPARHKRELWQLEQSIRLTQAMKRPIQSVVFAMGDSSRPEAEDVRTQMQGKLDTLLEKYNLSQLKQPITWGADETVLMAFAQTLDFGELPRKILVRISNPESKHRYDAEKTAKEIIPEKLDAVGLTKVNQGWDFDSSFATTNTEWDFEVAIVTRRPGGSNNQYQANDAEQAEFDENFLSRYRDYSPEQRSKLVIIDGRLFNGAWDSRSALQSCDLLAFGSWGTFGNAVGATLAIAKILFFAQNPFAQKQLYLEAVAHDVFANGYAEAQKGELKQQVNKTVGIKFDHYYGYKTDKDTAKVFAILNKLVNQRLKEHFADTNCLEGKNFSFTPQLWRTFESEVHLMPPLEPKIAQVGVFRKDLNPKVFQPKAK
ncbi:MAG: DUF4127 family protein [Symploca sp. SIO2C1]|nr:DUF4127 family protein [Symploca sp. SIO2C1]